MTSLLKVTLFHGCFSRLPNQTKHHNVDFILDINMYMLYFRHTRHEVK